MKKVIVLFLSIFTIFILSSCSSENTQTDLQSTKWNVVSNNGESYVAEFGKDTVSFVLGNFRQGFSYEIKDDEIKLTEKDEDPITFEINKDDEEYTFTAKTEEAKEQYGDLTLSPSK